MLRRASHNGSARRGGLDSHYRRSGHPGLLGRGPSGFTDRPLIPIASARDLQGVTDGHILCLVNIDRGPYWEKSNERPE